MVFHHQLIHFIIINNIYDNYMYHVFSTIYGMIKKVLRNKIIFIRLFAHSLLSLFDIFQ